MNHAYGELTATCGSKILIDKEDLHFFEGYNISLGVNKLYGIYKDNNDKIKYIHREVMAAEKGEQVDHINMNTLDNRKSNLRIASRSQNRANQRKSIYKDRNTTSSYKGVCFDKANNNWICRVHYEGQTLFNGRFKNEVAAALAYNHYASEIFGEFARLNEIPVSSSDIDWRDYQILKTVSDMQSGYSYVFAGKQKWKVYVTINGKQKRVGLYDDVIRAVLSANDFVIENSLHLLEKYPKKVQRLKKSDLEKLSLDQKIKYSQHLEEIIKKELEINEKITGSK